MARSASLFTITPTACFATGVCWADSAPWRGQIDSYFEFFLGFLLFPYGWVIALLLAVGPVAWWVRKNKVAKASGGKEHLRDVLVFFLMMPWMFLAIFWVSRVVAILIFT